jgi:hypothetical protein
MAPDQLPDPLAVALEMAELLERLHIPHLAAGSLASSFHGEPRSTNDVDFVVDLAPGRVPDLLAALGDRYYASADAMAEAVRAGGAFNLIHYATAVKVDLFVAGDDAFDAERLATRTRERIGTTDREVLAMDTANGATSSASSACREPGSTGTAWWHGQRGWASPTYWNARAGRDSRSWMCEPGSSPPLAVLPSGRLSCYPPPTALHLSPHDPQMVRARLDVPNTPISSPGSPRGR